MIFLKLHSNCDIHASHSLYIFKKSCNRPLVHEYDIMIYLFIYYSYLIHLKCLNTVTLFTFTFNTCIMLNEFLSFPTPLPHSLPIPHLSPPTFHSPLVPMPQGKCIVLIAEIKQHFIEDNRDIN